MALTEAKIRSAKAADRLQRVSDGGGLYLEVSPKGTKTFRLAIRENGKQRTLKLGVHPAMSLADARRERDRIKLNGAGEAPAAPKPKAKAKAPPSDAWEQVTARYLSLRHRQGIHRRTAVKLERQIERTVEALRGKRVGEVTAQDVLDLVRPIEDAGRVETAHEMRARCGQIFDYARSEGIPVGNPARDCTGAMVQRKRGAFPGLVDPKAVGRLMRAIRADEKSESQIRTGLLLSAYLAPRNDMIRGMTWDEIDFHEALWEVPAARMKGADAPDHLVPLPRQAVDLLRDIQRWSGDCLLVLPAPRGGDRKLSDGTFNKVLRRLGYCTRTQHCHHGFRTTFSTTLNEAGYNRDWIERQLAHVDQNAVRAGYNKARYLDGRRRMMQHYADWLDTVAADEEERVHRTRTGFGQRDASADPDGETRGLDNDAISVACECPGRA